MTVAEQAFVNKSVYLTALKSRTNQQQLKELSYLDGFSQNVQDIINKFHIRNEIDRLSRGRRTRASDRNLVTVRAVSALSRATPWMPPFIWRSTNFEAAVRCS